MQHSMLPLPLFVLFFFYIYILHRPAIIDCTHNNRWKNKNEKWWRALAILFEMQAIAAGVTNAI